MELLEHLVFYTHLLGFAAVVGGLVFYHLHSPRRAKAKRWQQCALHGEAGGMVAGVAAGVLAGGGPGGFAIAGGSAWIFHFPA